MTPYILFEIDNGLDLNTRARFLRHLDTLRVMGKLKHPEELRELVRGDSEHNLRPAYRLAVADYREHVLKPGWVNGQDRVYQTVSFGTTFSETPDLKATLAVPIHWTAVGLVAPETCDDALWFYDQTDRFYFAIAP